MISFGTAGDIIFPNSNISFIHQLIPFINTRKKLKEKDQKYLDYVNEVSSVLYKMHGIYNTLMAQIPEIRGFMFILNLIVTAFHLNHNLGSNGKMIKMENAFQITNVGKQYIDSIPKVFPGFPKLKRMLINVDFTRWEIIETFHNTCINQEIKRIINDEKEDFTKKGLIELCGKIDELYKKKVNVELGQYSNFFDDEDIHMDEFYNKSIIIIKELHHLMKKKLEKLLSEIEKNLDKKTKKINELSCKKIINECKNGINLFASNIKKKKEEEELNIIQFREILNQNKIDINEMIQNQPKNPTMQSTQQLSNLQKNNIILENKICVRTLDHTELLIFHLLLFILRLKLFYFSEKDQ